MSVFLWPPDRSDGATARWSIDGHVPAEKITIQNIRHTYSRTDSSCHSDVDVDC